MIIRNINENEIEKISEVYFRAYENHALENKWTLPSVIKYMHYWYLRKPDLFFVAEENSELIGGIVADVKPDWGGNYLTDAELFVHPDHQGKGLGKVLIKHIVTEAKSKYQIYYIEGLTFANLEFPLEWYKRIGFKIDENYVLIIGNTDEVLSNL